MSSTEQDVASPAAAVLERRRSRTTQEKRKQPSGDSESEESETGSDGEWTGDDDPLSDHGREDEDEEEDEAVLRGRVRPHAVVQGSNGLELDDGRHKSLAEKGWARRAVVVWAVWARVEEQSWRSCLGARSTAATRMARSTGPPPRCSSPRTTSTTTVLR